MPRAQKHVFKSKGEVRIFENSDESSTSDIGYVPQPTQEHARTRMKLRDSSQSVTDSNSTFSKTSLTSSITRFRTDFEDLKCKMRIFGESLNLCKCLADDFRRKLGVMEKRLENLERREKFARSESNYSAIIQKNKKLSNKTREEAKKLQMSSTGTEDEMRATAAKICQNYLHGTWKTVDPSKLVFRRISGGLSNFLYYVALPDDMATKYGGGFVHRDSPESDELEKDARALGRSCSFIHDEPTKVLLRIYGLVHGERAMDAIVTESVIFTLLSERRLGPKLHGVFSGGRIEEFIPARSLRTRELSEPALSMKIAEKMAAIHSMDVPLSKEPNWMWKITAKWLKTVKEERLAPGAKGKNEEENRVIARLRQIDWDKEMEWLRKFLASVESPVVFCHNDMQEGNILILEDEVQPTDETDTPGVQLLHIDNDSPIKTQKRPSQMIDSHYEDANTSDSMLSHISDSGEPKLVLIDFEYCAYNHRGFDIANHFQEWMYDYTNPEFPFYYECQEQCPTLEQKEIFIKEYLKHYNMNTSEDRMQMPTIDEINRLLNEVDAYALASHYFWTLWSIVNASKSQIPFGYWEYGLSRIETYLRLKQDVIKKDKCGYPQKRKICEVDI